MTNLRISLVVLLCAACGGSDSGVDGNKRLTSLSASEIRDICEYVADVEGPERTVDCGGGVTLTVGGGSVDECVADTSGSQAAYPNCSATVDDFEACAEAFADLTDAQLCSDEITLPTQCAPLLTAECSGE